MGRKNRGRGKPSTPTASALSSTKTKQSTSQDSQSSVASVELPPMANVVQEPPFSDPQPLPMQNSTTMANDIASSNQDIVAMADLFATMKKSLVSMTDSLDRLSIQSDKIVSCALDVKAADQVRQLRSALGDQIEKQRVEVEELRHNLEEKIKTAVRNQLREVVKESLRKTVREKVQQELAKGIPDHLRQQVLDHQRQILKVKTTLHNSEARRYNSLQTSAATNGPLRPLLRPLPTPEQSPIVPPLSRSGSVDNIITPAGAFPGVPNPTPIRRTVSNPFREPPTASTLFPTDLRALFAMGPDQTRQLLRDYGLVSESPTPAIEKAPGLPSSVNEKADVTSDKENASGENEEAHVADMNKFMAHIGVPFLMIPAPIVNDQTAPMSSKTRRRTFLTPLIIK